QNVENHVVQNAVQNPSIQIVENMNGLVLFQKLQIGVGIEMLLQYQLGAMVMVSMDAAYLQQQIQIAQEEEAGIQSTQEKFKFMAAADAYEETERVKASTSGTQSDKALVYDSDRSAEVSSMDQGGGTVEQHPVNIEETRVLYDSLYNNLAIEVGIFNSVIAS
nr:hypothetical protein [Tanacetum cinerariifolium]